MKPTRPKRNSPLFAAVSLLAVVLARPLSADAHRAKPPVPQQPVARSLRTVAAPKVQDLKQRLAATVGTIEVPQMPGRFMRSPQGFVQDVQRVSVTPTKDNALPYHGVIVVGVEWRSPDQSFFKSREEAKAAELTEAEAGHLYLLYVFQQGKWNYLRTIPRTPTRDDWKPRPKPAEPEQLDVSKMSL
jgi:hypothetical protein